MGRYLDAKETAAPGDEMDRAVQDQLVENGLKVHGPVRVGGPGWGAGRVSGERKGDLLFGLGSTPEPQPMRERLELAKVTSPLQRLLKILLLNVSETEILSCIIRHRQPDGSASGSGDTDRRYDTCREANAAGLGPYVEGVDPEYYWYQDRDNDGVVCET